MKLMISGIVVFSVFSVFVAGVWFLLKDDKSQAEAPITIEESSSAQEVSESTAQAPLNIDTKSQSLEEKTGSAAKTIGPKLLVHAKRNQVKLSEESGGIGPTSFVTGHNGEVYFADRFNDRVVEITPDGKERVIYKSDPNEYIRGHGIDPSGNSYVLVGNNKYSLMKVTPEGEVEKLNFTHEPEHLDGMRVEAREDAVYLIGAEKTVKIDKATGEKSDMYGVPSRTSAESLDVILTEEGRVMATFRDAKTGSPDRTVEVGTDKHGAVVGTYALENGSFVMAMTSDPSASDQNTTSPKITFQQISPSGELGPALTIDAGISDDSYSIDIPIVVTETRKIQQAIAGPNGTEVKEYELP